MSGLRISMLVHGGPESVELVRARELSRDHPAHDLQCLWREGSRAATAERWRAHVTAFDPHLLYIVNTAMPGALLACGWRLRRRLPFILDTGDVVYEMAARSGITPAWKRPALKLVESLTQRLAHTIVVRGTRHREYLQRRGYRRVELIRDGCSPSARVDAGRVAALRARLGLENAFVVGVMGSLVMSPRLGMCYGWDLIQALHHVRDLPVRGVIIGDGNGRSWLEEQARRLGVAERITFCGRIPYAEVPTYLGVLDIALSTQTNNLPGQVRTTGKLPEYMAAGRFILASRVGEAELVLPEPMLVDYDGEVDVQYPARLADRIRAVWNTPALLDRRHELRGTAERYFSYEVLRRSFYQVVAAVSPSGTARKPCAPSTR